MEKDEDLMPISYQISLTDKKTGEEKIFSSAVNASAYLRRSKSYVRIRMSRGDKTATDINGNKYDLAIISVNKFSSKPKKPKNPDNAKYAGYKEPTLCYRCARAVGFCKWSKKGEAIEGWLAIPTKLKNGQSRNGSGEVVPASVVDSYHVINCPMFLEEGKTVEERREQRKRLMKERVNERISGV